jgi:hypothetical protein
MMGRRIGMGCSGALGPESVPCGDASGLQARRLCLGREQALAGFRAAEETRCRRAGGLRGKISRVEVNARAERGTRLAAVASQARRQKG